MTLDAGLGGAAHHHGLDMVVRDVTLVRQADGRYEGEMLVTSYGYFSGVFLGERCTGRWSGRQSLLVVGRPRPGSGIDPSTEVNVEGVPGGDDLLLAFYPASVPSGTGFESFTVSDPSTCVQTIGFDGGGPDNQPPGEYLPFNDSRWTTPDLGYLVHLPLSGTLLYDDEHQVQPELGINSVWIVQATVCPSPEPCSEEP